MSEIDEVDDKVDIINLGPDRLFRIEIGQRHNYLRLGLKEINVDPLYYYESFYTKDDLVKMNVIFKCLKNVGQVVNQFSKLIKIRATLKSDNDEAIIVSFSIPIFDGEEFINFILKKKNITHI